MVIYFEGLDGSGKSTQIKLLFNFLSSKGFSVKVTSFPDYETPMGHIIYNYLKSPVDDYSPEFMAKLFADERVTRKKSLQNDSVSYDFLILDRYSLSTYAYQASRINSKKERSLFIRKWADFEFIQHSIPFPDVLFFLKLTPEQITTRLDHLSKSPERHHEPDAYEQDVKFQLRVLRAYEELQLKPEWYTPPNNKLEWRVVEALQDSPEEISKLIINQLSWLIFNDPEGRFSSLKNKLRV